VKTVCKITLAMAMYASSADAQCVTAGGTPPANGAIGTCTDALAADATCQFDCDAGFTVPGFSDCGASDGIASPFAPATCAACTSGYVASAGTATSCTDWTTPTCQAGESLAAGTDIADATCTACAG
jgi:hypothetical protein